jgi:hypothetical protein
MCFISILEKDIIKFNSADNYLKVRCGRFLVKLIKVSQKNF